MAAALSQAPAVGRKADQGYEQHVRDCSCGAVLGLHDAEGAAFEIAGAKGIRVQTKAHCRMPVQKMGKGNRVPRFGKESRIVRRGRFEWRRMFKPDHGIVRDPFETRYGRAEIGKASCR